MIPRRSISCWLCLCSRRAADGPGLPELQGGGRQPGRARQALADGYSCSILVMMAMPFALLGTGALLVARAVKRGALPEL